MKRQLSACMLLVLCLSGCSMMSSSVPHDTINKAADAYRKGDYDKAITLYENVRARGFESGELYYDLGNAYLKKGEIGRAIVNYTRAKYYIPRDSELMANYNCALTMMKQQNPSPRASPLFSELMRLFSIFTIRETIIIFLLIYYLLSGLCIYVILVKRRHIIAITAALIIAVSLCLTALPMVDKIHESEKGIIVVSPVVDARKEPYDDGPTSFPLYGGMKGYLMKERVGWLKIRRPDGRMGWAPSSSVEKIWK